MPWILYFFLLYFLDIILLSPTRPRYYTSFSYTSWILYFLSYTSRIVVSFIHTPWILYFFLLYFLDTILFILYVVDSSFFHPHALDTKLLSPILPGYSFSCSNLSYNTILLSPILPGYYSSFSDSSYILLLTLKVTIIKQRYLKWIFLTFILKKRKFWNICTSRSKIGWLKMNKENYWQTSVGTYL